MDLKISIIKISYQRNGCSGTGFFTIEFDMVDVGCRKARRMLATMTPEDLANTRVIALDEVHEAWRGDMIGEAILEALGATRETADDVLFKIWQETLEAVQS